MNSEFQEKGQCIYIYFGHIEHLLFRRTEAKRNSVSSVVQYLFRLCLKILIAQVIQSRSEKSPGAAKAITYIHGPSRTLVSQTRNNCGCIQVHKTIQKGKKVRFMAEMLISCQYALQRSSEVLS